MAGGQELQGLKWLGWRSSPQTIRARNARCCLGGAPPPTGSDPLPPPPPSNITNTSDNCRGSAPAPWTRSSLIRSRSVVGLVSGVGTDLSVRLKLKWEKLDKIGLVAWK